MLKCLLALISALCVCAIFQGCAVSSSAMVPRDLALGEGLKGNVTVLVTGGDEVSFFKDGLDKDEFREGLIRAIEKYRLFASVPNGDDADFKLDVDLVHLTLPEGAFARESKLLARWTLRQRGREAPIFEDFIESKATGSGFDGGTRTITAIEGAARENIAEAFRRMSALPRP